MEKIYSWLNSPHQNPGCASGRIYCLLLTDFSSDYMGRIRNELRNAAGVMCLFFFRHKYEIFKIAHNLYEPSQLTATNGPRSNDFVTVIWSLSEGLDKMALGIVKIRLESPFSANRRCSQSVCRGQLSWTLICSRKISVFMCESSVYVGPTTFG